MLQIKCFCLFFKMSFNYISYILSFFLIVLVHALLFLFAHNNYTVLFQVFIFYTMNDLLQNALFK